MKKILITGAAGFIGYHLTCHLLKKHKNDASFLLVDNLQRGKNDKYFSSLIKNPRIKFLNLDLTKIDSYKKLGKNYDHVYHLAAINGTKNFYEMPHETLRINTLSLVYILEWFRKYSKNGKICFTSSNEAYAGALDAFNILPIPTPENAPLVISDTYNPRWSYAASKLVGELFIIHYAKKYNFRALIVRPHNFYGPRAGYDHVIPEFCIRVQKRTNPFPIYSADETRTFCYIEDAVKAMQMLMDSKKTDKQPIETVHIGQKKETKIEEIAEKIFDVAKWKPKKIEIKPSPKGSVKRRLPDIKKLEKLTGWKPKTDLKEGVEKTYHWYLENPKK